MPKKLPKSDFLRFVSRVAGPTLKKHKRAPRLLYGIKGLPDRVRRRHWDLAAKKFAEVERDATSRQIQDNQVQAFITVGEIKANDRITSIGSGTAIMEAFFAKKLAPQGHVNCVDFSHGMNQIARKTRRMAKAENMHIVDASGQHLPIAAGSQDKVIFSNISFLSKSNWGKMLQESRRVLKKTLDSKIIILESNMSVGERIALLEENAFEIVRTPSFHYTVPENASHEARRFAHFRLIIARPKF